MFTPRTEYRAAARFIWPFALLSALPASEVAENSGHGLHSLWVEYEPTC